MKNETTKRNETLEKILSIVHKKDFSEWKGPSLRRGFLLA
jgi:hypothetical protein